MLTKQRLLLNSKRMKKVTSCVIGESDTPIRMNSCKHSCTNTTSIYLCSQISTRGADTPANMHYTASNNRLLDSYCFMDHLRNFSFIPFSGWTCHPHLQRTQIPYQCIPHPVKHQVILLKLPNSTHLL